MLLVVVGGKAQGVWEYDVYSPYVTDYTQITANSWQYDDGSETLEEGLENLIDDNTSTYFHSCWSGDDSDGSFFPSDSLAYHWLQFDLGAEYDSVLFHYEPREVTSGLNAHTPSDIDIYMTNTPDDEDSWELITQIVGIWPYDGSVIPTSYTSDPIVPSEPRQYVRFVVVKASTTESSNNLNYLGQSFFALSEINWYAPVWNEDQAELLASLIDSIAALELTFTTGTDPGYYDEDAVAAYEEAYAAAEEGAYEALTDEEYYALAQALRAALTNVLNSLIPAEDGYYYIVNGGSFTQNDPDTYEVIAVEMAMYSDGEALYWEEWDSTNYEQIFEIEELEDGYYSIYHPASDTYVSGVEDLETAVPMTSVLETEQNVEPIGDGLFAIYSTMSALAYHTAGHSSGSGTSGSVVIWSTTYNTDTRNVWYLRPVDDSLLDSLTSSYAQVIIDRTLEELVDSANATYAECFTYDYDDDTTNGIITSTSQFTSNYPETTEGSYDYLIDGETSTGYYHSSWSVTYDDYHNMQVMLTEPIDKFVLAMFSRESSNVDTPNEVRLFATNDETLGVDSISDNDDWTEIGFYKFDVEETSGSKFYSTGIDLGGSYQYLRFVVEGTASGRGMYFTVSEFQLIDYTLDEEGSQYNYIEGLSTEVDEMMSMAETAAEKAENSTGTQDDIDELRAQIALVRSIMITTDEYDELYAEAEDLYEGATIGTDPGYTTQEAIDALGAAMTEAEEAAELDYPTKETLAAGVEILEAAIEAFKESLVPFDEDKWYYIIVAVDEDDEDNVDWYGRALYMAAGELYGTAPTSMLRHGGVDEYGIMTDDALLDPRFMWRVVETDGGYYLQNRGLGLGIGYNDGGLAYASSDEEVFNLNYVSGGIFTITYEGDDDSYGAYLYGYYEAIWLAASTYIGTSYPRSLWHFYEVEGVDYVVAEAMNNNIRVQTYPYEIGTFDDGTTIAEMNDVQTYSVINVTYDETTGASTVELKSQDTFEAGEPFVLVVGDYNSYAGPLASDTLMLVYPTPSDFQPGQPGTSNGLVGTYNSQSLTKEGLGYFNYVETTNDDDETEYSLEFSVSDSENAISIYMLSGYFVPVTEAGTEDPDLTLTFADGEITSVISATQTVEDESEVVNVYDLNGRLVKSGVKAGSATSGLQKGIYIVGNKKVVVK